MPKVAKPDFTLVQKGWQYRNREDQTLLPPGVLVVGSQNVVTNTSGRIQLVKGYTLDGASSDVLAAIMGAYDYEMHTGYIRNLRCYTDPTSGKSILQYRYVDPTTKLVTWRTLTDILSRSLVRFTDFWDTTELQTRLLFVDGTPNIYSWTGGIEIVASVTGNTITKQGTTTWAEEGFAFSGSNKVTIGGVDYTYTGGGGTVTLTGVTPDPATGGVVNGDIAHQTVVTTANSSITDLPSDYTNNIIASLKNQIYVSSTNTRDIYVSKVNDWTDFQYSTPTRAVGEGAFLTLDGVPTAMKPQEDQMYISATPGQWYITQFVTSADLAGESLNINRLKTAADQQCLSQELVSHDKNSIIFVSKEPVLTSIGRIQNVFQTPQMVDLSFSIVNDFNSYDFTDGAVKYHKNFIYVAVPKKSVVRIYNQTDPNRIYWEAPVTYPICRFSVIDGELYGHSYNTPETYKLFNGYNFNGQPIPAVATFSYMAYGTRSQTKGFNEFYVEGYINPNTTLTVNIRKEIDGCAVDSSFLIEGNNSKYVCIGGSAAPLGKDPIGFNPLGGDLSEYTDLPPKFRKIITMPTMPYFYEAQFGFQNTETDARWEILAFGALILPTSDLNTSIKD